MDSSYLFVKMYLGHFAIGFALKALMPSINSLPILMGVGFLDVIDGILIFLGIEKTSPNLAAGPYLFFNLDFIDWDHSVLMAVVLSFVWATCFLPDLRVATAALVACFSHFLADLPMHNNDLALYPYSVEHLGYGLWGKLLTWAWVLEGLFSLALVWWGTTRFHARGVSVFGPIVILIILFLNLSPWLSPMKFIASLDNEDVANKLHGVLVFLGFFGPGIVLTRMIDEAEKKKLLLTLAKDK